MGYTHYWNNAEFTTKQWDALSKDATALFGHCKMEGILLAEEYDKPNTPPHIGMECILFNGQGDEGHETFMLEKTPNESNFCKTARKDYDVAVVALLHIAAYHNPKLIYTSDGEVDELADGVKLGDNIINRFKTGQVIDGVCDELPDLPGLTLHTK